jgi:hypothetical protein
MYMTERLRGLGVHKMRIMPTKDRRPLPLLARLDRPDAGFPASTFAHLYPVPQHVVLTRMLRTGVGPIPPARWAKTIQDRESELPRIPIPRTWVNKGNEEGPGKVCNDKEPGHQ